MTHQLAAERNAAPNPHKKQAASFHHAPVCARGNAQHSPAVGRQAAAAAAAPTPLMQQRRATTPPPRGCKLPRCLVFWFAWVWLVVHRSIVMDHSKLLSYSYSHNCTKTVEEDEEHALFGSLFAWKKKTASFPRSPAAFATATTSPDQRIVQLIQLNPLDGADDKRGKQPEQGFVR